MSFDLQLYSNLYCTIDGRLQCEVQAITVNKISGLNPVDTLLKGFAGMSQGSPRQEISVDSAIPGVDFEFLPDGYMLEGKVVEFGLIGAGRQTVAKGFITSANYSQSVNAESKLSFQAMCQFTSFE
jgi:hypothetical protein